MSEALLLQVRWGQQWLQQGRLQTLTRKFYIPLCSPHFHFLIFHVKDWSFLALKAFCSSVYYINQRNATKVTPLWARLSDEIICDSTYKSGNKGSAGPSNVSEPMQEFPRLTIECVSVCVWGGNIHHMWRIGSDCESVWMLQKQHRLWTLGLS